MRFCKEDGRCSKIRNEKSSSALLFKISYILFHRDTNPDVARLISSYFARWMACEFDSRFAVIVGEYPRVAVFFVAMEV